MIWWLDDPARLQKERLAISQLEANESWIRNIQWRPLSAQGELSFEVSFDLLHAGETFPFILRYPEYFPRTPPLVFPVGDQRLSSHQYGAGGELCLEFRPDNWETDITGAMMIESAYKLISGERPTEGRGEVPSAHNVSLGQKLRSQKARFLLTNQLKQKLESIQPVTVIPATFTENGSNKVWVALLTSMAPEGVAAEWTDMTVSTDSKYPALVLRGHNFGSLAEDPELVFIANLIRQEGYEEYAQKLLADQDLRGVLLADDRTVKFGFIFEKDNNREIWWYETIEAPVEKQRLPNEYAALNAKTVGIVGCGSLGSKVAASLARTGIGKFVLVDDDILMPGNIVRHDLDTSRIGLHKAAAVKARLKDIAPNCQVFVREIAFGGQESSGTAASVLKQLSDCDIIIDATAEPRAFNFCSAAAEVGRKPLVWAEIFAGGIGGMVARARPDKDPPPLAARRQIQAWCDEQGVPWLGAAADYRVEETDKNPLIADDADVSIIAGHCTHFATDALLHSEDSAFPCSAYMVGFMNEWLFTQPYDTRGIILTPEPWKNAEPIDEAAMQEAAHFILSLLPKKAEGGE